MDASPITGHPRPDASIDRARQDMLQGASLACRFFGMLFHGQPGEAFLDILLDQDLMNDWPLPETEVAGQGLALLRDFLARPRAEALALARRDFTDLFIGPEQPLMQWESAWTTKDRLLFGEPAMAVRALYAQYGLAAPGPDPDDHIALELAFLGELLGQAAQAAGEGRGDESERLAEAAGAFFAAHPSRWAASLLRDMERRACTDLFRGAALLCRATLDLLADILPPTPDGARA